MILLIISILFSPIIKADYPTYHLKPGKLKISNYDFNRYALPQLRSIVRDYYFVAEQLNSDIKYSYTYKKKFVEVWRSWQECFETCLRDEEDCFNKYKSFFTKFSKLELSLLRGLSQVEDSISLQHFLLQLDEWEKLKLLTSQFLISPKSIEASNSLNHINRSLDVLYSQNDIWITKLTPAKYQDVFQQVYPNFIRPVERHILGERNRTYLTKQLGELNWSWNLFHNQLSKGDTKLPKELQRALTIAHRRWNSILKIILR